MNILFFNRSFYPDTEATGQFLTELCEDLINYGHNVTVVSGKPYKLGDKKINLFIRLEKYKSIDIVRTGGTYFPKQILLFRLVNLSMYFILAFIGGFLTKNKPNVVVAQTDPPVLGLLGIFFSKWYKAKFIYYCQDIYPEVGIATGKLTNPFLNFLLKQINLLSFKMADRVISIGEDMKKVIISKKVNENKIVVIYNWADTSTLYPIPNSKNPYISKFKLPREFAIMYSGNIGLTQGLEKIVEVADYFKSEKKVKFIFVGEGAGKANLQKLVDKKDLSNVIFFPYEPKDKITYSLNVPDIHLIACEKGLAGILVPSKVYGILACGKPFVAWIDEDSEISAMAKKFSCGITIAPDDVKGMITTIQWSINHKDELLKMGENGVKAAVEFFDRKISTNKFNKMVVDL